jgi:hypothetical protein
MNLRRPRLRACRGQPHGGRAAEQRDEFATSRCLPRFGTTRFQLRPSKREIAGSETKPRSALRCKNLERRKVEMGLVSRVSPVQTALLAWAHDDNLFAAVFAAATVVAIMGAVRRRV